MDVKTSQQGARSSQGGKRRSASPWSTTAAPVFGDERGLSLVEILVASVIVAISAVGMALMFSTGQAFIEGEGDTRVSVYLAQQQIEQIRAVGYSYLLNHMPITTCPATLPTGYSGSCIVVCVSGDDYSVIPESCPSGVPPPGLMITATVQTSPADAKARSVTISSVLSGR